MIGTIDPSPFAGECAPVPAAEFIGALLRTGFSAEAYRDVYGDLAALNWDATQALGHFIRHGLNERRAAPMALDRDALVALARLKLDDTVFKAKLLTSLSGHLFDNVSHPFGDALVQRWPAIRALLREGARAYFVAGDSHSNQYNLTGARGSEWLLPIHLLCTGGSAVGLGNPSSHSNYGSHLRKAVEVIDALPGAGDMPFLLQFGQVDIEFVHHFQREKDGLRALNLDHYRAFCQATFDRYIAFVTELFPAARRRHVHLVSVFPPALSDAAWHQGYVNADIAMRETSVPLAELTAGIHALEIASLAERTQIHTDYNALLQAACESHGFRFVDGCTPFLGADAVVHPHYAVPEAQGAEHHLDSRQTYRVVVDLVWRCIDASGAQAERRQASDINRRVNIGGESAADEPQGNIR
jgi:hypothetical protein